MSLSFQQLRIANNARQQVYVNNSGDKVEPWTPAQWFQAMIGELGEYANFRKKYERGDLSEEDFRREAERELADAQTYFDLLADSVDIDLGEATRRKWNEVAERKNLPFRLSTDGHLTTATQGESFE